MAVSATMMVMASTGRPILVARLSVAAAVLVLGLPTVGVARRTDDASMVGASVPGDIFLVVVGWALTVAGLLLTRRSDGQATGALFIAGGFLWFVGEWNSQFAGSAIIFTVGLVLSTAVPVVIAHGLLRYNARRVDGFERFVLAVGYISSAILAGGLPTLSFDPGRQGCANCPANLLAVQSDPVLTAQLIRIGLIVGPVWTGLLAVCVGRVLIQSGSAVRRSAGSVLAPGMVFLVAACASSCYGVGRTFVPAMPETRFLWVVEGSALLVMSIGTCWPAVHRRLVRNRVARLVVELAAASSADGLRGVLARSLRDPGLQVLYRLEDDRLVDAAGLPAVPLDGQASTRVVRSGQTVAVLVHRRGLLDEPGLAAQITQASQLVMESERLQAQSRAQLAELRAASARIVEAGDRERRRLERDLHDGAQQLLVALSLALQLAALRKAADAAQCARLTEARKEVGDTLAALRVLARGIYPRELADEGIAAAVEALAENSPARIAILGLPVGRYPPAVEAVTYQVVARTSRSGGPEGVTVLAADHDGKLTVEVRGCGLTDPAVLEDRVGALGGLLSVEREGTGGLTVRAVLPCGS